MKLRLGTKREDGMIFWGLRSGKEIWLLPDKFAARIAKRRDYQKKCRQAYKERQSRKNEMDRNYLGKYDFARNLYFIGVNSAGKEVWGTKAELESSREQHRELGSVYRKRCIENYEKTDLVFGSPHPTQTGLFVVRKIGNKLFWGDKKELERRRESVLISRNKRKIILQKRRKLFRETIGDKKLTRGTVREDGKIFWKYNPNCYEEWLTPERFEEKSQADKKRKKSE